MSNMITQPTAASGAMAIATSRQSADSQTQMIAAKHYPRDENTALARILRACERPSLAEAAVYSYKKGDGTIEGPSIRLAEVMAQNWGNMNFGFVVLESSAEESQVQAFAWDLETNTRREVTFPVSHLRVTKTASWLLTDPREIYETVANAAARRVRMCILAIIPGDIPEAAIAACTQTLTKQTGKPLPERIKDMVTQFEQMLVTVPMLEARLQTPRAAWTAQQVIAMGRLFVSLRDGFLKREEIPEFVVDAEPQVSEKSQKAKRKPDSDVKAKPFPEQIEEAKRPIDLDAIERAIVAANLPEDETAFYKSMVTEARARIKAAQ